MRYILNYILLMLSTIMVIKAYERDGAQRTSGRNSKHHVLNMDHTRDVYPRSYNAEVGQKTTIGTLHSIDDSRHHPVTGRIPATVYYNQLPSVNNKENGQKLLAKHEKVSQYDTSSSHADSHILKYKDHNVQGGNYQYNHPDRQTQTAYRDNNPPERYEIQTGSRDSDIKDYQKSQADRPREYDSNSSDDSKNLKYESPREDMRQTDYNEYKEKNTVPFRYSHSVSDYPRKREHKENYQQNYPPHSSELSDKPSDDQHNQMPHKKDPEVFSSKEPSNYHRYNSDQGSAPINSEYKDTSYLEGPQILSDYRDSSHTKQYHTTSSHRDSSPSKQSHTDSDYRDSSHSKQYHTTSSHRDSNPSKQSHTDSDYRDSSHPKQFHSHSDYRNSRLPKHPRSNFDYIHPDHPENSQTNSKVRGSNASEKSHSGLDYKDPSPSGIPHSNSNYRDTNLPQDHHNDRGQSHRQNPDGYIHDHRNLPPREQSLRQSSRNEAKNSRKQPAELLNETNPMRVVSTKKDMQPAPSGSDSSFSEEHDGFLDMGAYTDKQGSFGWYADFPVGKEHDKVTYSFS